MGKKVGTAAFRGGSETLNPKPIGSYRDPSLHSPKGFRVLRASWAKLVGSYSELYSFPTVRVQGLGLRALSGLCGAKAVNPEPVRW